MYSIPETLKDKLHVIFTHHSMVFAHNEMILYRVMGLKGNKKRHIRVKGIVKPHIPT